MPDLTRRSYLSLSAAALVGVSGCQSSGRIESLSAGAATGAQIPDSGSFSLGSTVYLNAGSQHPISNHARASLDAYLQHRSAHAPGDGYRLGADTLVEKFARLVNADPEEITFVQSTTTAEQMIVRSLMLPQSGGHIVTDKLHFFGSIPLYLEMEKAGCEVTWVDARNGRILLEDMDRAITPGTRLVALSLVSTVNGFEHDLKAVCELAHSRGALVYADIIHAAGCVPVDLHGSGVDFAACASYKWLMGDFGLGFVYVRKQALQHLQRTNYGYYGVEKFVSHIYPLDPPGNAIADYSFEESAAGWFALGTYSHTAIALLNASLDYITMLGVKNIQAHAQSLSNRLKQGLLSQGYELLTPPEATTPLVAAICENARERLAPRLKSAGIVTTVSANRFRPSVSVFNTLDDVEALLDAVGPA